MFMIDLNGAVKYELCSLGILGGFRCIQIEGNVRDVEEGIVPTARDGRPHPWP